MGGRGRGRKSKAALVSGGQPEDNTGSHHPGKDVDRAAASAATGNRPEKNLDPDAAEAGAPDHYVFPPDWWDTHDIYEFPDSYLKFVATQIKTDPRFNAGRTLYLEWPETERIKFYALSDQLEVVEKEILKLEKERVEIKREIHRLELIPDTPLDEHFIIAFVKEIEREIQYPKFEDYLKTRVDIQHDSDDIDTFKRLVQTEKVHKRHKKLDFEDIRHAISGRIRDLRIERDRELKAEKEQNLTSLEEDQKDFWQLPFEDPGEDLSSNPIGDLVKAICHKRYYMHWDPLHELKIIEKCNPHFYSKYFLAKVLMKYSETRVMVSNVPRSYLLDDVADLLSVCGKITRVEMDRVESSTRIAYVTFQDPGGARIAPILMERTFFSIFPVPEPRKFTINKETLRKFEKSLRRYNDFRRGIFNRRY